VNRKWKPGIVFKAGLEMWAAGEQCCSGACATGKTTAIKKIFELAELKSHKWFVLYQLTSCQL
jgi:hypothetical protein